MIRPVYLLLAKAEALVADELFGPGLHVVGRAQSAQLGRQDVLRDEAVQRAHVVTVHVDLKRGFKLFINKIPYDDLV